METNFLLMYLAQNLKLAAEDEESEVKTYRVFEKTAREEGFEEIANAFKMLSDVEHCHKLMFEDLYNQLKNFLDKSDKQLCHATIF